MSAVELYLYSMQVYEKATIIVLPLTLQTLKISHKISDSEYISLLV